MNLKEKVIKGVMWSATEKWGQQAISFVVFLFLARLLAPEDFGLVALASIYIELIGVFLDMGWGVAIVQRVDLEDAHLDTAFWINIVMGVFFAVSGILLSGVISNIFNEPRLSPIVAWLSISFFISSFSLTQQAIVQRKMDFASLAVRSLIAKLCGGIVGVSLALAGFGVWSLVAQSLVSGFVSVIVLWSVSNWRPRFHFSISHFKDMFTFGLNLLGVRAINFIDLRIDDMLIGYFLGVTILGYYSIAYRMLLLSQDFIMGIAQQVIFTAFSSIQKDIKRLSVAFYNTSQLASLVAWPVFIGMAMIAPELIIGAFGEKWIPSIPVLQILALSGIPLCILFLSGQVAISLGKPSWHLVVRIVISIARVITFAIAARLGIIAVAIAFTFTNFFIFTPMNIWLARHLLKLNVKFFDYLIMPIPISLLMAIVILGLKYIMQDVSGLYWQIIVYIAAGVSVYFLALRYYRPIIFRQILDIAYSLSLKKGKG